MINSINAAFTDSKAWLFFVLLEVAVGLLQWRAVITIDRESVMLPTTRGVMAVRET